MPRKIGVQLNRCSAFYRALIVSAALLMLSACGGKNWRLIDIRHNLPDLDFSLTDGRGQAVTAHAYRGKISVIYFGYTHCPDVCPATMARLMQALQMLGDDAREVRILFISVDPARDTLKLMQSYAASFDPQHMIGLTGTDKQIRALAKRYRIAYQLEQPRTDKSYDVTHSSVVYIFDKHGRARLAATPTASPEDIAHDLRILIRES